MTAVVSHTSKAGDQVDPAALAALGVDPESELTTKIEYRVDGFVAMPNGVIDIVVNGYVRGANDVMFFIKTEGENNASLKLAPVIKPPVPAANQLNQITGAVEVKQGDEHPMVASVDMFLDEQIQDIPKINTRREAFAFIKKLLYEFLNKSSPIFRDSVSDEEVDPVKKVKKEKDTDGI